MEGWRVTIGKEVRQTAPHSSPHASCLGGVCLGIPLQGPWFYRALLVLGVWASLSVTVQCDIHRPPSLQPLLPLCSQEHSTLLSNLCKKKGTCLFMVKDSPQ